MTFIVVEGIDGVGKSTFAKELSSRLRARYVTSVPSHLLGMKRFVDAYASAATHYMFYRYCIHATSKKIRQHLRRGETVVADRYWYTTVATHRTLGVPCRSSDFASVVQPDVVYFVTASEDVRVQRMVRRGLDANDVRMRDTATALLENFTRVLPRDIVVPLDSSNLQPSELVSTILPTLPTRRHA